MVKNPLLLTFDCGTQSIRALLFDTKGKLVAKSKMSFEPYFSIKPGYAEQHPTFYYEKLCRASRALKEANEDIWDQIIGVTVTTMRNTCVSLDEEGNVVRPSILWLDQREADIASYPLLSTLGFGIVGMYEAVREQSRMTKSNWIQIHEPGNWEKTKHYILLSGYMTYRLTNNIVDSVASQIGHLPFDYKKKDWMPESHIKYCIFNVPREKLSPLKEVGEVLGHISRKASEETGLKEGLPLIATGSDKGCETLGTGCIAEDTASLSFGTTSTMQMTLSKYTEPQRFLPAYPAVLPGCYNPEVEIFRGYWMVSWFKKEFAAKELELATNLDKTPEEILNELLLGVPAGCHGLVLQPYWGPGLKNPKAKGAVIGFSDVHTRAHLYRAIIEGINYGLRDGLETVQKRVGNRVKQLTVSGGGSQSDMICQITADMFNLPVLRTQTYETSGLGSSIAGFVGLGVFKDYKEAIEEMVHYTSVFQPQKDCTETYEHLYQNVYKKIYKKLKPLYKAMRRYEIK